MSLKLLFIGGGNMAASIIAGLINHNWSAADIMAADPDSATLKKLADGYKIKTTSDNSQYISEADFIILAVKPQIIKKVASSLKTDLAKKQAAIISIAAGISMEKLTNYLGGGFNIIRTMPNTPALVQQGITGMYAKPGTPGMVKSQAEKIMRAVGDVIWLQNEDLINSVTAVSGSGPAYFFLMFEAMQESAIELGLDAVTAKKLITQTAIGAGMLGKSDTDFASLRQSVTSKGGTTEQALQTLNRNDFKQIINRALKAAFKRAVELAGD